MIAAQFEREDDATGEKNKYIYVYIYYIFEEKNRRIFVKMRNPIAVVILFLLAVSIFCDGTTNAYNVLMATMGGTKSHTIPFVALGISLKTRGHNVTLLSAFPGPAANNGLQEFVPPIFEVTSQFFTP